MRPYKIPKANVWVDLDTIQEIQEPKFEDRMGSGGYYIVLRWQHAFQDEPREHWFYQPANFEKGVGAEPVRDEHGEPSELAVIRREAFEPFLRAWSMPKFVREAKKDDAEESALVKSLQTLLVFCEHYASAAGRRDLLVRPEMAQARQVLLQTVGVNPASLSCPYCTEEGKYK